VYVLVGGKALSAAVKSHGGESALIHRCQVRKRRNVLDHLSEDRRPLVAQKLNAAFAREDYEAARLARHKLHRELIATVKRRKASLSGSQGSATSSGSWAFTLVLLAPPLISRVRASTSWLLSLGLRR
jgi:hypothetical protein